MNECIVYIYSTRIVKKYDFSLFLAVPCSMWSLKFPNQGSNPGSLHWNLGILTIGLPGKSF